MALKLNLTLTQTHRDRRTASRRRVAVALRFWNLWPSDSDCRNLKACSESTRAGPGPHWDSDRTRLPGLPGPVPGARRPTGSDGQGTLPSQIQA